MISSISGVSIVQLREDYRCLPKHVFACNLEVSFQVFDRFDFFRLDFSEHSFVEPSTWQ